MAEQPAMATMAAAGSSLRGNNGTSREQLRQQQVLKRVVIKLHLTGDVREEVGVAGDAPLLHRVRIPPESSNPYRGLKERAILLARRATSDRDDDSSEEDDVGGGAPLGLEPPPEVVVPAYRAKFLYTDVDGDTVRIGSSEELVDALAQYAPAGSIKIAALIKKKQQQGGRLSLSASSFPTLSSSVLTDVSPLTAANLHSVVAPGSAPDPLAVAPEEAAAPEEDAAPPEPDRAAAAEEKKAKADDAAQEENRKVAAPSGPPAEVAGSSPRVAPAGKSEGDTDRDSESGDVDAMVAAFAAFAAGRQEGQQQPEVAGAPPSVSSSPPSSSPPFIHGRHTCDGCLSTPIIGRRYHATNMKDYDLCEKCRHNYKGEDICFEVVESDKDRDQQGRWQRRFTKKGAFGRFFPGGGGFFGRGPYVSTAPPPPSATQQQQQQLEPLSEQPTGGAEPAPNPEDGRPGAEEAKSEAGDDLQQQEESPAEVEMLVLPPANMFVHGRHTCDKCFETPIVGKRFHSTNLPDYDLCESCRGEYTGTEIHFIEEENESDRHFQERWRRRYARQQRERARGKFVVDRNAARIHRATMFLVQFEKTTRAAIAVGELSDLVFTKEELHEETAKLPDVEQAMLLEWFEGMKVPTSCGAGKTPPAIVETGQDNGQDNGQVKCAKALLGMFEKGLRIHVALKELSALAECRAELERALPADSAAALKGLRDMIRDHPHVGGGAEKAPIVAGEAGASTVAIVPDVHDGTVANEQEVVAVVEEATTEVAEEAAACEAAPEPADSVPIAVVEEAIMEIAEEAAACEAAPEPVDSVPIAESARRDAPERVEDKVGSGAALKPEEEDVSPPEGTHKSPVAPTKHKQPAAAEEEDESSSKENMKVLLTADSYEEVCVTSSLASVEKGTLDAEDIAGDMSISSEESPSAEQGREDIEGKADGEDAISANEKVGQKKKSAPKDSPGLSDSATLPPDAPDFFAYGDEGNVAAANLEASRKNEAPTDFDGIEGLRISPIKGLRPKSKSTQKRSPRGSGLASLSPGALESFASDAEGDVAAAIGETLDKFAEAIESMNLELARDALREEENEGFSVDTGFCSDVAYSMVEDSAIGGGAAASGDKGEVIVEGAEGCGVVESGAATPAVASQVSAGNSRDEHGETIVSAASTEYEAKDDGISDSWSEVDETECAGGDRSLAQATAFLGSALFQSDVHRSCEGFADGPAVEREHAPVRERWAAHVSQLHEMGFIDDELSLGILERLGSSGGPGNDEVTIQQVLEEMFKN